MALSPPSDNAKNGTSHEPTYAPSTSAVHADDIYNARVTDVAPAIHVSTTFRYPSDPTALIPFRPATRPNTLYPWQASDEHCYSRISTPTTNRLETILSTLLKAPCVTYSSGLAALHGLLTHINPKVISIGDGYHGCHGVVGLHTRLTGAKKLPLDCDAEELSEGDLICLETPINPTGLALDIAHYAEKAHSRGAYLMVDSTFGPPPLQDPFAQGADVVMHSGTKYLGGHSDMLCGVLAVRPGLAGATPDEVELSPGQKHREGWIVKLLNDRLYIGAVMGGLEGWLGLRSIRTLELRVGRQSESATWIVSELMRKLSSDEVVKKVVKTVKHASLQEEKWVKKQMPGGYGPVFSLVLNAGKLAQYLPSKLHLYHHATSLGGVESLIEWRTMTDSTISEDILRVSIGVEAKEDLMDDLLQGFTKLVEEFNL